MNAFAQAELQQFTQWYVDWAPNLPVEKQILHHWSIATKNYLF